MSNHPSSKPQSLSKEFKKTAPLFVFKNTCQEDTKSFWYFLDDLPEYTDLVSGWKDKNGKPGITLVNSKKERIGVVICHNEEDAKKAQRLIRDHLSILGF